MRLAASLAFILVASAAVADEAAFLFDALQVRPYRASWDKLMKEVEPTPDWLLQFNKNFDGVTGQIRPMTIDGKAYELTFVCKPGDCADRRFEVLFEAGGSHAYGALGGRNAEPAYFGGPAPALQDVLAKAIKG
jgi:Inhibitor of vertebrate lysozyme (Ivy)